MLGGTTETTMVATQCIPQMTDVARHLFAEGTHAHIDRFLGAHPCTHNDVEGVWFAVWAPHARAVAATGVFDDWSGRHPLECDPTTGIWSGFVAGARQSMLYKYRVTGVDGEVTDRADPVGFLHQTPPETASIVWSPNYQWRDHAWLQHRRRIDARLAPISIYEVHLGSWMRRVEDGNRSLSYQELATGLVEYVQASGFTHVEFLPLATHPFYGSWGYQSTGFFAPSHRYGKPEELMACIDALHQAGIGVILDWSPAHFPRDGHGLARFDGAPLYEHPDPRRGEQPDWGTLVFNYGLGPVSSFLLSAARRWFELFHIDAMRVDAVASMLYLDYSRGPGQWLANEFGGREHLEAIAFLRRLTTMVAEQFEGSLMIAEESTSWPKVSHPVAQGGLGFSFKWDMGWMHDTLRYLGRDPIHRKHHHNELTFRQMYADSEAFVLPLSHDEVVHAKGSLLGKMHGSPEHDSWRSFAHLRLLLCLQFSTPGKKLLFMGSEFGQRNEWNHDQSLDWHLLEQPQHRGIYRLVCALNRLYVQQPALHRGDCQVDRGFIWLVADDAERSVVVFCRRDPTNPGDHGIIVALNFTPVPRHGYRVEVGRARSWQVVLNSDDDVYGGSGCGPTEILAAQTVDGSDAAPTLELTLPPLGAVFLRPVD